MVSHSIESRYSSRFLTLSRLFAAGCDEITCSALHDRVVAFEMEANDIRSERLASNLDLNAQRVKKLKEIRRN